ncbi:MAG: phage portal protein [Firmicutes bacterium]|nr:phage portal protein [[Eubacterium] siraeum]MCM1486796.1 phage portal protein [Bacillota bacterium]
MAKKHIAAGYSDAGASHSKRSLRAFNAVSASPVEDIDFNNLTLRQRGRMLYMAAPIAASAINTNCTKIVGRGLRMKCNLNTDMLGLSSEAAKKWCRQTEAEFRLWCENRTNCDALGMNNFFELQHLAVKSWLMSGDVFVLLKRQKATALNPYTLRLQLIEADRVCTPYTADGTIYALTEGKYRNNDIHDGVEVDSSGRVTAYHICSEHPTSSFIAKQSKWTRVEAVGKLTGLPNILHIMDAERPDQYRGVTYLAPVIEMLLQGRRYTESELTAAIIQSYYTAWITTDEDTTSLPNIGQDDGEDEEEYPEPEMGPGTVVHLKTGESVNFGNPQMPTAGYENFVKSIIKQVGAALELPYDVLIKEFNSSYSAAKGALEEAWEVFKKRRNWFVNDFCQPVYEVWLSEAVANGRIKATGFFDNPLIRSAWCGARWDGPAQTHLDPVKEAKANAAEVAYGWKTNEQITREYYGENWEENIRTLKAERELMRDAGILADVGQGFDFDEDKDESDREDEED